MKKFRFPAFVLIFTLLTALFAPPAAALDDPGVDCYAGVLMSIEGDSETILYTKNADDLVYPASLTKIMTVMLAVEAIEAGTVSLSDPVTAKPGFDYDQIEGGSTVYMGLGEVMTLENLLYCAMLQSANETCNVIAEYIGGSVGGFVDMMNQRAAELGCVNTHFVNTHGLPDPDHYTTAMDFALIAREAVSHDLFMEICNTPKKTIPATNLAAERELNNSNSLINKDSIYPGDYLYEGAAGVKTGHTNDAGYCLVSTAERDGVRLLSVVMNAQSYELDNGSWYYGNFADTILLFDWGFDNFSYQEIVKSTDIVAEVPVLMGADTNGVAARPSSSITALLPNDVNLEEFTRSITITSEETGEELQAPIAAGQPLGEITVSKDGVVYGTSTLVASSAVDLSRTQYMKNQLMETLRLPAVIITFWILVALIVLYVLLVVRYRAKRRAYLRRLENAKKADLDLVDDDEGGDGVYERKMPGKAWATGGKKAAGREELYIEPEDLTDEEAPGEETPAEDPETAATRVNPVLSDDGKDENFRDYFDEFFGDDKDAPERPQRPEGDKTGRGRRRK